MIKNEVLLRILAIGLLAWSSGSFATDSPGANNRSAHNASPESIVVCFGVGPHNYVMSGMSVPTGISDEVCHQPVPPNDTNLCAPCLGDLERQGCNIVDVVVGTEKFADGHATPAPTYLLSYERP